MSTTTIFPELPCFTVIKDAHVVEIALNQPHNRNSLGEAFWNQFPQMLACVAGLDDVRAVILHGEGPHFCSGIDLGFISNLLAPGEGDDARSRDRISSRIRQLQAAFLQLERLQIPVIAAVHGGAIGAGLELACTADFRLCTRDAFFQLMEVQVAIVADLGGLQRLNRQLPVGITRELAYTGRRFSSQEALTWGFVNSLHDDKDALLEAARSIARQIAANSPLTVKYIKECLASEHSAEVERDLRQAAIVQVAYGLGEDLPKALKAIKQGEQASFAALEKP